MELRRATANFIGYPVSTLEKVFAEGRKKKPWRTKVHCQVVLREIPFEFQIEFIALVIRLRAKPDDTIFLCE
jgi:hypothetical protein